MGFDHWYWEGNLLSFTFYWKKLSVFALLVAVGISGYVFVVSRQTSEASVRRQAIPTTPVASLAVALQDGGTSTVNGQVMTGLIRFEPNRQIFDYQAYLKDGSFVDQLTTTVTLPRLVNATQLVARHTASYGVVTEEPIVSGATITYVARNLTPDASYRIELVMPPGTVQPSLLGRLVDGIRNLSPVWWLSIALGLPLVALGILSLMFAAALRSWRGPSVSQEQESIPATDGVPTPPALAAILLGGKVSPRALAATLLHLANRGYIQVVHRDSGFTFGKRRTIDLTTPQMQTDLTVYEQILLDKIFRADAIKSSDVDIQVRLGQHLFSRKVAQAYLAMYDATVQLGWFVRNPQAIYRGYRSAALGVISLSVVGFVVSLIFGPQPYFYLLGWAGLFFVGLVMYQITPLLPRRTAVGDAQYKQWLAFRNYLTSARRIANVTTAQQLYTQYLPYAVALGVEVEWTERFLGTPFHVPDWYTSSGNVSVIEDFANNLFPIIGSVATDLASVREPNAV